MNDIKKETKKENFYLDKDNIKYIENESKLFKKERGYKKNYKRA